MPAVIDINAARSPLRYALAYAERGWHVFPVWGADGGACRCGQPCKSPGKHPVSSLVRGGMSDATTDPETIKRWWQTLPEAGVGVSLAPSGLVAVDVDPRNGGYLTLEMLEDQHGRIETDLVQLTQGGGEHRFFYLEAGSSLQLPGKLGPGVDLKRNGYSVLPPTMGPQGVYDWEASSNPLDGALPAPLPDWIRSLAQPITTAGAEFSGTVAARHVTEGQVEELRSALTALDHDDRNTWVRVLGALHTLGSVGWDLALEWSQRSAKFDPQDQVRVWRSVLGQRLNYETVFHMAIAAGWSNPYAAGVPVDADTIAPPPAPPKPAPTPESVQIIPGILGLGVRWFMGAAKKPQIEYALPAMLALGSVVLGRRYVTDYDNWSPLYFLAVGKSATGKEFIKTAIEDVLAAADLDGLITADRYSSESAGLSALEARPCQISVQDEFGKILAAAQNDRAGHARSVVKFLLEVWGRAGGTLRGAAYSTVGMKKDDADAYNNRLVYNPSLTLVGLTTPNTLESGLTRDAIEDGFLNRFLVSVCDADREPMVFRDSQSPPAALVEWCRRQRGAQPGEGNLAEFETPAGIKPTPVVVPLGRGVRELFFGADAFEGRCVKRMDALDASGLAEIWGRANEAALRVALIVARSCEADTIEIPHAQWAIQYVEHCTERLELLAQEHIHEGDFDAARKAVIKLAAKGGARGVTCREINKGARTFRRLAEKSPHLQDTLLKRLTEDGTLALVKIPSQSGRGKPREAYVLQDDGANNADTADTTPTPFVGGYNAGGTGA
ncbi:MAG: bifunctional DNA primase/polymerase [Halieaceae bacterium]|nr:bifunctional DNA primase/polymerase [Halieaceae bacterium]